MEDAMLAMPPSHEGGGEFRPSTALEGKWRASICEFLFRRLACQTTTGVGSARPSQLLGYTRERARTASIASRCARTSAHLVMHQHAHLR